MGVNDVVIWMLPMWMEFCRFVGVYGEERVSDCEAIIISRAHQLKCQRVVSINSAFFFHSPSISFLWHKKTKKKKNKKWRKGR